MNYFKNKFYLTFNKIYLLAFTENLYIQRVKKTVSDNLQILISSLQKYGQINKNMIKVQHIFVKPLLTSAIWTGPLKFWAI